MSSTDFKDLEKQRNKRLFQSLKSTLSSRSKELSSNKQLEIQQRIKQKLLQEMECNEKELKETKQKRLVSDYETRLKNAAKCTVFEPKIYYSLNSV